MAALSLSQAARLTGLGKVTITRAIKSSWHSASGKVDGTYDIEAAEPKPSARQSRSLIPWSSARAQVVTEAELRQRVALAEEKLAALKTALDDMRAQRDAWQAMAQARIRAPVSARSRWCWLRST
jgi:ABC-type nitrate/sulfonate/bicarbonate transport system ATPase subunit